MSVRKKKIRLLVTELLAEHGLNDGPVPVDEVIAALGITLDVSPAPDHRSGYIARDVENDVCVIGVNAQHSLNRQRFTMAHELGHYLLHRGYEIHVDRSDGSTAALQINLRGDVASEGTDDEEREANYFAAELLMPAFMLERDLNNIVMSDLLDENATEISDLARKYKVSTRALTYRLSNLDYIHL